MTRVKQFLAGAPWLWSFLASLVLWIVIGIIGHRFSVQTLATSATLATFLAIIGIGQMFAVSGGDGGIDLSIPYTITLTAFVSEGIMKGSNGNFVTGMVVCLLAGVAIGLINAVLILGLKLPAIIGTLAMGYIVDSAGLLYAHGFSSGNVSPLLTHLVQGKVFGVSWLIIIAALLALFFAAVLNWTPFGRSLVAVGQNRAAAQLAGIRVIRTRAGSFVLSGLLAALGGVMLSAYSGGAFLDMGSPYLLTSIGAVVVGGTLISGGKSTVLGTLGGALFLTLVVTLVEVTNLPVGVQDILEGALIVLVLMMANRSAVEP